MKKEIIQTLKIITLGTLFITGVSFASPANPPSNNAPTPINVGGASQVKIGGLGTGPLAVFGLSQMYGNVNIKNDLDNTAGNLYVSGNIGVGIASPTEKLDVAGNIKISSVAHPTVASNAQVCADTTGKIVSCGNKCGSAQGITGSKPTTNLCAVGTPHTVYSGYPGCTPGVYDASCPDTGLPAQGNTYSPNDTNQWLWTCEGAGVPVSCNSFRPI